MDLELKGEFFSPEIIVWAVFEDLETEDTRGEGETLGLTSPGCTFDENRNFSP